jgi:FkbH-like protein
MVRHAEALARDLSSLTRRPDEAGGGSPAVALQFKTAVSLASQFMDDTDPNRAPDYLAGWLQIVALQHPETFATFPFAPDLVGAVLQTWQVRMASDLSPEAQARLAGQLDRAAAQLSSRSERTLRLLFIGDCLTWDIATHLQISARAEGYEVEPVLLAKRLGVDLRNALKNMRSDAYDLIFYSPFSFGFSDAYAAYIAPRNVLKPAYSMHPALMEAVDNVRRSVGLLAQTFECPLYVHTVSGIMQTESGWRGRLAELVTRPRRQRAAYTLNAAMLTTINKTAAVTGKPILRIDEAEPLTRHTAATLGRVRFNAGDLHPTALAHELAGGAYRRACRVATQLKGRKLVVCDLDNTLWNGVIGDGAVHQHADRQAALLRLKAKGIVLAVSSKNDPANVRWDEAILSPEDFVATEINWGRKAPNIRRISRTLNLNPDSFVFLDDRPDERATVTEELPGILALDPNEAETWTMISEWTDTLGPSALADRTKLYQERATRQKYLEDDSDEDLSEAYRKLDLRLELRSPAKKDMDRVVELINRTNQFNTTTARTSIVEMTDPDVPRYILVAQTSDRFGDMGIVGTLVVTGKDAPEITHFVLSCRVFGFGIEVAMVQSALTHFEGQTLRAKLVTTPVNGPCRDIYSQNRFERDGEDWVSTGPAPDLVPDWLTVTDSAAQGEGDD